MKSSNLFVIQNLPDRQMKTRRRFKTAVLSVLGINAAVLLALLIQGCRQEQSVPLSESTATNAPTPFLATNSPAASSNSTVQLVVTNPPTTLSSSAVEYTIAKGDMFSTVAKRFHVSIKAIIEANPDVDPTRLRIGQKIQIPTSSSLTAAGTATTTTTEGATRDTAYAVQSGDTLSRIAGRFGTTPKAIRQENGLTTDRIVTGQILKIPAKTSTRNPTSAREQTNSPVYGAISGTTNRAN
ncbi:MAG TPA: LysM peptidoglycan-binding domain-containing protein [Candidatus Acidoferrales bacterium]|nr:LysM peptidoglycan-binding domain-containing protein [Candidatus Acidoferrales bacterium]